MKRCLLIHYGEIGLKLSNKDYFVGKLKQRIKLKLEKRFRMNFVVKHSLGRLLIPLENSFDEKAYVDVLSRIFGIKNFKFCYLGAANIQELGGQILALLPEERPSNFRVKVKRSMTMDMKSVEMEREIGAMLLRGGFEVPVKMKGAEFIVDIEFLNEMSYVSFKKHEGVGGLSGNSQGKLISLISAGIDSPVASYKMMKRGARIIFVHFHAYPYTDKHEMEQVKDLVEILGDYQFGTKLYLVPYGDIQRAIATNLEIPDKVRIILYRRTMIRIAEKIAKKEKAKGLVTGDSFGQVASQTPENLYAVHDASTIPLFQPLISFDKEDVIKIAEEIGTFEISKLPCKDTCTMFMPKKPEIRANVYDIRDYEKSLPLDEWVEKALKDSELVTFD